MANSSGSRVWLVCALLLIGASCADDSSSSERCGNGIDDDGNGVADCDDAACAADPSCAHVEICDNGLDDDGNGVADCDDTDCVGHPACPPLEICDNELDDDGNGVADCDDAACVAEPACQLPDEICDNGLDDDGDDAADCDDDDCNAEPACQLPDEICDNELDDDGDDDVDCGDDDCAAEPLCAPPPTEICDNELDDDGDLAVDCADPGCAGIDPCIQLGSPGDVVIVEMMVDPASVADSAGEWIELHNTTGADIDIAGWVLHDIDADAPEWHIIGGDGPVVITAGGSLVLGALADSTNNGGVDVDYEWASFALANDADEVVLEVKGEQIDVVSYATASWPLSPGRSLSLDPAALTAVANDDPLAWCVGSTAYNGSDYGTPGTANPACP